MSNVSGNFVTVDLRGLKAPLIAQARVERVSLSVIVRRSIAADLKAAEPKLGVTRVPTDSRPTKVSIRLTALEAAQLAARAKADGTSMGTLLARLAAQVPALTTGGDRASCLAALVGSNAELSTLNRNLHDLATLLRQGSVQAAQEYGALLETLAGDVRSHLRLASATSADLRPRRSLPAARR